jgi:methyltransferase
MTPAILLLIFVTAERLIELWWARSNTRRLRALGAVEHAPGHYPLIVVLHAVWLAGLWLLGWSEAVSPGWLAVFIALQLLRAWVLITLGRRWTTRILVLPGAPLVRTGPYRFLSHPNYAVVAGEIAVLPLCLGLGWYALVFSILNAGVLLIRIRAEAAALSGAPTGPRA